MECPKSDTPFIYEHCWSCDNEITLFIMQRVCRLNPHRFPGGEINAEQNYYPQQQHGRHKTKQKNVPKQVPLMYAQ